MLHIKMWTMQMRIQCVANICANNALHYFEVYWCSYHCAVAACKLWSEVFPLCTWWCGCLLLLHIILLCCWRLWHCCTPLQFPVWSWLTEWILPPLLQIFIQFSTLMICFWCRTYNLVDEYFVIAIFDSENIESIWYFFPFVVWNVLVLKFPKYNFSV